jgi:hypothetical protein
MNLLPSVKNLSLILYVQVFIPGCGISISVNLFLDFIELEDVTEKGNFSSRFQHLQPFGMTEHYISKHLVSFCCLQLCSSDAKKSFWSSEIDGRKTSSLIVYMKCHGPYCYVLL